VRTSRFLDVDAYPVCSADFLAANAGLKSAAELASFPLLDIAGQQDLWSEWLRAAGVTVPARISHVFDNLHLLYRAAGSGLGVALGIDVVVEPYLEQGQLIRPFETCFKLTKGDYTVIPS